MKRRRRLGRVSGVCGLTLLALGGTILLAVERQHEVVAAPVDPPTVAWMGFFPDYPGAEPWVPVADSFQIGGLKTHVSTLTTPDRPEEVQRFYAEAFRNEGLAVQVSEGEAPVMGVTARDGVRHQQRMITIVPGPDRTVVFASLSPTDVLPEAPPPLRLPVTPDARLVSDTSALDGARRSRTVTMVSQMEPDQALATLEARLERARFSRIQTASAGHTAVLHARAPWGAAVTYTVSGGPDRPTAIVVVSRTGPGGAP